MIEDRIKNQLTEITDPEVGKNFPLEDEDRHFISLYSEGYDLII